ncbi:Acid phosphatase-like protein 2 [Mortierella alpina]|nr:Acid phosphatase-like protein 2 [Mortierella alpina]
MHILKPTLAAITVLVVQVTSQPSAYGDLYSDYDYCQGITSIAHKTYQPIKNGSLRKVQVIMRHGDRTPSTFLPGDNTNYDLCSRPAEYNFVADGDQELRRTAGPILRSNVLVSTEENLFAAKSPEPQRSVYPQHVHLAHKGVRRELSARILSTKPSSIRRRLTLNTYPESIETLILNPAACPRLGQLYKAFFKTPTFTTYYKRNYALMQKVNSILGVSHLPDFNSTINADTIMPRYCNHLPLGCSAQNPKSCLTAKDAIEGMAEGTFMYYSAVFRYEDSAEQVKRLAVGPFLKSFSASIRATVAQNRSNSSQRRDQQRVRPFELYSAHDQSLDQVLAVIAEPNTPWPAYASTLIFETWATHSKTDVIRVLYEGKVVPANPTLNCTLDACPLETFLQFIESYIPTDISAECSPTMA